MRRQCQDHRRRATHLRSRSRTRPGHFAGNTRAPPLLVPPLLMVRPIRRSERTVVPATGVERQMDPPVRSGASDPVVNAILPRGGVLRGASPGAPVTEQRGRGRSERKHAVSPPGSWPPAHVRNVVAVVPADVGRPRCPGLTRQRRARTAWWCSRTWAPEVADHARPVRTPALGGSPVGLGRGCTSGHKGGRTSHAHGARLRAASRRPTAQRWRVA